MVRTYKQEKNNYRLTSPWEQAMRNAEAEEGRQIATGKRVYENNGIAQATYDFDHNIKQPKLPPIQDGHQQTLAHFSQEIGEILSRSSEKLKKIEGEFVLYDPSETGSVSKSAVVEILRRYRIPKNEKDQKKLAACFIKKDSTQIDRFELFDYLEACKEEADKKENSPEKSAASKSSSEENARYADGTHGRYDSLQSMEEPMTSNNDIKPAAFGRGTIHREAFQEKRDVGLMLEIERAFKSANVKDPHKMIDKLENKLQQTCRNDEHLTDNMNVKNWVDKHQFPLNSALTMKCIDRLDPQDAGRIEYPKFIAFLRKAVASIPPVVKEQPMTYSPDGHYSKLPTTNYMKLPDKRIDTSSTWRSEDSQKRFASPEYIPEKPAWETRAPLQGIARDKNVPVQSSESPDPWDTRAPLQGITRNKNVPMQSSESPDEIIFEPYETSSRIDTATSVGRGTKATASATTNMNDCRERSTKATRSLTRNMDDGDQMQELNEQSSHTQHQPKKTYPPKKQTPYQAERSQTQQQTPDLLDSDIEDAFEKYAKQLKNEDYGSNNEDNGLRDQNKTSDSQNDIPDNLGYNSQDLDYGHQTESNDSKQNMSNSFEFDSNAGLNNDFAGLNNDDTGFHSDDYNQEQTEDESETDFSLMGDRGIAYKRAADALKDKSKRSNDIIDSKEVLTIINFHNSLFDTNFDMNKVIEVVKTYSLDDRIDVRRVISCFGSEII